MGRHTQTELAALGASPGGTCPQVLFECPHMLETDGNIPAFSFFNPFGGRRNADPDDAESSVAKKGNCLQVSRAALARARTFVRVISRTLIPLSRAPAPRRSQYCIPTENSFATLKTLKATPGYCCSAKAGAFNDFQGSLQIPGVANVPQLADVRLWQYGEGESAFG